MKKILLSLVMFQGECLFLSKAKLLQVFSSFVFSFLFFLNRRSVMSPAERLMFITCCGYEAVITLIRGGEMLLCCHVIPLGRCFLRSSWLRMRQPVKELTNLSLSGTL